MELANGAWIEAGRNVLIAGPTGVGKSYIACALGNLAARTAGQPFFRRLMTDFCEGPGHQACLQAGLCRVGFSTRPPLDARRVHDAPTTAL